MVARAVFFEIDSESILSVKPIPKISVSVWKSLNICIKIEKFPLVALNKFQVYSDSI